MLLQCTGAFNFFWGQNVWTLQKASVQSVTPIVLVRWRFVCPRPTGVLWGRTGTLRASDRRSGESRAVAGRAEDGSHLVHGGAMSALPGRQGRTGGTRATLSTGFPSSDGVEERSAHLEVLVAAARLVLLWPLRSGWEWKSRSQFKHSLWMQVEHWMLTEEMPQMLQFSAKQDKIQKSKIQKKQFCISSVEQRDAPGWVFCILSRLWLALEGWRWYRSSHASQKGLPSQDGQRSVDAPPQRLHWPTAGGAEDSRDRIRIEKDKYLDNEWETFYCTKLFGKEIKVVLLF